MGSSACFRRLGNAEAFRLTSKWNRVDRSAAGALRFLSGDAGGKRNGGESEGPGEKSSGSNGQKAKSEKEKDGKAAPEGSIAKAKNESGEKSKIMSLFDNIETSTDPTGSADGAASLQKGKAPDEETVKSKGPDAEGFGSKNDDKGEGEVEQSKIAALFENIKMSSMLNKRQTSDKSTADEKESSSAPKSQELSKNRIAEILQNVKKNVGANAQGRDPSKAGSLKGQSDVSGKDSESSESKRSDKTGEEGDDHASDLALWSATLFGSKRSEPKKTEGSSSMDPLMYLGGASGAREEQEQTGPPEHEMFHEFHTKDIPSEELEQMYTVFRLLDKHQKDIASDPASFRIHRCPLFDEIDFPVNRLPRLPQEILDAFKKEVPAEISDETVYIGQKLSAVERNESVPADNSTWNQVDKETADKDMEHRIYQRTPEESRPARMTQNPLLAPLNSPNIEPYCRLTVRKKELGRHVDYREAAILDTFLDDAGRILPGYKTHLTTKAQHHMRKMVKRARAIGLLSFTNKIEFPPKSDYESGAVIAEVVGDLTRIREELKQKKAKKKSRGNS